MPGRSVVRIVRRRLLLAAAAAVLVQTILTIGAMVIDEGRMSRAFVGHETHALAQALRWRGDEIVLAPSSALAHYWGKHSDAYAFSVAHEGGRTLLTRNRSLFIGREGYEDATAEDDDFWIDHIAPGYFHIAGGEVVAVGGRRLQLTIGTRGDPAGRRFVAVADRFWLQVAWPLWPALALMLIIGIITINAALRPLSRIASLAADIEAGDRRLALNPAGLPREGTALVGVINTLLDQVDHLLAAQRRLMATTAHELRTPLTVMMLQLDHLPADQAQALEGDVEYMSAAVERLTLLTRLQERSALSLEKLDLTLLVSDVLRLLTPLAQDQGTKLEFKQLCPSSILGDSVAILQALKNAIENAIRHGRRNGRVRISCLPSARIVVEDDGPGIEPADLMRLFEPFQRGATVAEGSGLGMAIMREAVTAHGGTVSVDQSPLGGVRLTLDFAAALRDRSAETEPQTNPDEPRIGQHPHLAH